MCKRALLLINVDAENDRGKVVSASTIVPSARSLLRSCLGQYSRTWTRCTLYKKYHIITTSNIAQRRAYTVYRRLKILKLALYRVVQAGTSTQFNSAHKTQYNEYARALHQNMPQTAKGKKHRTLLRGPLANQNPHHIASPP